VQLLKVAVSLPRYTLWAQFKVFNNYNYIKQFTMFEREAFGINEQVFAGQTPFLLPINSGKD